MNEGLQGEEVISANLATQILGWSGLSSVACFWIIPRFTRKTILSVGHLSMSIFLGCISFSMVHKNSLLTALFMNLFMVAI